jgi:hypothetical protein
MPDQNPAPELPAPNVSLTAIGHLVRVLEARLPGLTDAWLQSLEDEHFHQEVIRFRGPRVTQALKDANDQARAWAALVRALAKGVPAPKVKGRKAGKSRRA